MEFIFFLKAFFWVLWLSEFLILTKYLLYVLHCYYPEFLYFCTPELVPLFAGFQAFFSEYIFKFVDCI